MYACFRRLWILLTFSQTKAFKDLTFSPHSHKWSWFRSFREKTLLADTPLISNNLKQLGINAFCSDFEFSNFCETLCSLELTKTFQNSNFVCGPSWNREKLFRLRLMLFQTTKTPHEAFPSTISRPFLLLCNTNHTGTTGTCWDQTWRFRPETWVGKVWYSSLFRYWPEKLFAFQKELEIV